MLGLPGAAERGRERCHSRIGVEPMPHQPPSAGGYHAIIVPAGGQKDGGPPAHVLARLERAAELYEGSAR